MRRPTLVLTHADCLAHDPGPGHPERARRLRAVLGALRAPGFADLAWRAAPPADREALERVHAPDFLERVERLCPARGQWNLDPDTFVSARSLDAARRAAGAAMAAVDAVCRGEAANAFCAVRPPGHHAETRHALGFCLVNNLAVGARHAQARHGLSRIAIVDFDAHHGNGAQNIFWDDASVLVASIHEWPLDLITGAEDERGAHGQIVNVPLAAGDDGALMRAGVDGRIVPALRAFRPDLILLAAGFDGHRRDPLAHLRFETADFAWLAGRMLELADELCRGRLVASLEGGYDLPALGASAAAFVRRMMRHRREGHA